jgi:hypothetical protein
VTWRSTRATTRSLMFEMARRYRVLRALPWCSGIETENGSSWLTIHRKYLNPVVKKYDARHCGFIQEELDSIINYDITSRMGKELESGEKGE